jgi:hypothetical protein
MLLPAVKLVRESSRLSSCESRQRQIVVAMQVYAPENSGRWPVIGFTTSLVRDDNMHRASDGVSCGMYDGNFYPTSTMATHEMLAAFTNGDLPPKIFGCPGVPEEYPPGPPADVGYHAGAATPTWAATMGAKVRNAQAYAYDWSIPIKHKASIRIVTGDRPRTATGSTATAHRRKAVFAYADGHTVTISAIPSQATPTSGTKTVRVVTSSTSEYSGAFYANPLMTADGIFDQVTDGTPAFLSDRAHHGPPDRTSLK